MVSGFKKAPYAALLLWALALAGCAQEPPGGEVEAGSSVAEGAPPNVIVLLTDDQRHDALGVAGNSIIQTPHLDALAKDGIYFPNAFVTTSICAVSRASIFSGQYARRSGIQGFATNFSQEAFAYTYPAVFRRAGYYTGFIGKYGIGSDLPTDAFDEWYGFSGQGTYYQKDAQGNDIHLTRKIGLQAVSFLESAAAKEQSFALSISFKAPHVEPPHFASDPAFDSLYADARIPEPADTAYSKLPAFGFSENPEEEGRARWNVRFSTDSLYQTNVKKYYRLVTGVDRVVGQIREELESLGLAENTIILFTSDNGFYLGEHGLAGKWYGHEESIRVPMILYDPRLPTHMRGSVRDEMVLNIDVAPTLLSMAGLEVPARVQGQDMSRLIHAPRPQGDTWRHDFFYEHLFDYDGRILKTEGVVQQRFKYLRYLDPEPDYEVLYDTEEDPHETQNLASDPAYQDTLNAMRDRWAYLRTALR